MSTSGFAENLPLLTSEISWGARQLCYAARRLPYYGRSLPLLASVLPSLREIVVETEDCGPICLDLRERVCIPVFVHGRYPHQSPEDRVLGCLLHEGATVFDIGANIGYYTNFIRKRVGVGGKVVAVEPTSRAFRLLEKNLGLGPRNAVILKVAVGAVPGEAQFQEQRNLDTSFVNFGQSGGKTAVPVETLDRLVARHGMPAVMKIDVEGAELLALEGARAILGSERAPIVMIEYIQENAARFSGYSRDQLLAYFPAPQFAVYRIAAPGKLIDVNAKAPAMTNDYLAVPARRIAEIGDLLAG